MRDKFDFEEQLRQAREEVNAYEKAAEQSKQIANLNKQKTELQKTIAKNVTSNLPDAGTIRRMTAGFSALSPVDAIYRANEATLKNQNFATSFAKAYGKSVANSVKTAFIGKDYMLDQKYYKDILTKQMGMKDGKLATGLGLLGDITIDPVNFGALKPVFATVKKIGSMSVGLASKIPQINRGIESFKTNFNLFYELEKALPKGDVNKFKAAFREAVESKDFTKLAELGYNVSNYAKIKGAIVSKFRTATPVMTQNPAFQKMLAEESLYNTKLMTAQRELTVLQHPSTLTAKWNAFNNGKKMTMSFDDFVKGHPDISAKKAEIAMLQNKSNSLQAALSKMSKNNTVMQDDSVAYKILDTAFGPQTKSGFLGKSLDATAGLFKRVMSWSPKFQTRNFMGALTQGIAEGSHLKDYWKSLQMVTGKGKVETGLYNILQKSGVMSQSGMFEQAMSRIPAKVAGFGESLHRTALAIADMRKGKTIEEAIEHTQQVFYKYGDAYKTKFEKTVASRVMPFYSFFKGQVEYWPKALAEKTAFYTTMGKVKQDTEPDSVKNHPFLTPEYWKDMFSVGTIGNIGFQLEDFLKNATGNVKNLWGQLNPLIKGGIEGLSGWNVFAGKSIASNRGAGAYAYMPSPIQKLMGFNQHDNTVNPWTKWSLESMFGPILDPIKNLFDPKKSIWNTFTSVKDYDLSLSALNNQDKMNRKQNRSGGVWDVIKRYYGFGVSSANAADGSGTGGGGSNWNADMIADYNNKFGAGTFGKKFIIGGDPASGAVFSAQQKSYEDAAKLAGMAGPDIGENFAKQSELQNKILASQKDYYDNLVDYSEKEKQLDKFVKWAGPRASGSKPYFSEADLFKYQTPLGTNEGERWFKEAQKGLMQFISKTAEIGRAGEYTSTHSIFRQMKADMFLAQSQRNAGGFSEDIYQRRVEAILERANLQFDKLKARQLSSQAEILEKWAKASVNTLDEIEIKRKAAELKFMSSDAYRDAKAEGEKQRIQALNDFRNANDAEHDKLRNDELAKQAKQYMEDIEKRETKMFENLVKGLDDVYKRGGMSIEKYYGKIFDGLQTKFKKEVIGTKGVIDANMKTVPEGTDANAIKEWNALINIISDPNSEPEKIQKAYTDGLNLLSDKLSKFNVTILGEALTRLANTATQFKTDVKVNADNVSKDTDTFNKALKDLEDYSLKLRISIAQNPAFGDQQVPGLVNKDSREYKQFAGNNPLNTRVMTETEQAVMFGQLSLNKDSALDQLKKAIALPSNDAVFSQQGDKSNNDYFDAIIKEYKEFNEKRAEISEQGKDKLNAIERAISDYTINTIHITNAAYEDALNKRLNLASSMTQTMLGISQTLYDMSGQQSHAAFYVMKSLAIADATIKGYQSVMNAYKAGSEINPYVGATYAAIAGAFVGTQIAAIVQTMASGPAKKAEGGSITGGSGTRDDVPILAMGGEFVMRKAAVNKYGETFMNALNQGLVPVGQSSFSVPSMPINAHQIEFAEGGMVGARANAPISVELKNQSGTQLKATKSEASWDGQQYVLSVFIDALDRNVGGLRDKLGG